MNNLNDEIGAAMLVEPVSEANNLCYYASIYSYSNNELCNGEPCAYNYVC